MVNYNRHKLFIGVTSIIMLIVGLVFGLYWSKYFDAFYFQVVNIGLTFVIIILLLLIGSLVLNLSATLNFQLMQKSRRKK